MRPPRRDGRRRGPTPATHATCAEAGTAVARTVTGAGPATTRPARIAVSTSERRSRRSGRRPERSPSTGLVGATSEAEDRRRPTPRDHRDGRRGVAVAGLTATAKAGTAVARGRCGGAARRARRRICRGDDRRALASMVAAARARVRTGNPPRQARAARRAVLATRRASGRRQATCRRTRSRHSSTGRVRRRTRRRRRARRAPDSRSGARARRPSRWRELRQEAGGSGLLARARSEHGGRCAPPRTPCRDALRRAAPGATAGRSVDRGSTRRAGAAATHVLRLGAAARRRRAAGRPPTSPPRVPAGGPATSCWATRRTAPRPRSWSSAGRRPRPTRRRRAPPAGALDGGEPRARRRPGGAERRADHEPAARSAHREDRHGAVRRGGREPRSGAGRRVRRRVLRLHVAVDALALVDLRAVPAHEDYVAPRPLPLRRCAASGTKFFDGNANGSATGASGASRASRSGRTTTTTASSTRRAVLRDRQRRALRHRGHPPTRRHLHAARDDRRQAAKDGHRLALLVSERVDAGRLHRRARALRVRMGTDPVGHTPNARGRDFGDWYPGRLVVRKQLRPAGGSLRPPRRRRRRRRAGGGRRRPRRPRAAARPLRRRGGAHGGHRRRRLRVQRAVQDRDPAGRDACGHGLAGRRAASARRPRSATSAGARRDEPRDADGHGASYVSGRGRRRGRAPVDVCVSRSHMDPRAATGKSNSFPPPVTRRRWRSSSGARKPRPAPGKPRRFPESAAGRSTSRRATAAESGPRPERPSGAARAALVVAGMLGRLATDRAGTGARDGGEPPTRVAHGRSRRSGHAIREARVEIIGSSTSHATSKRRDR